MVINDKTILITDSFNIFKAMGSEGFSIYSYLLKNKNKDNKCEITIKMLLKFFNSYDSDIKLDYGNNKQCKIGTLKDKKTIFRYFEALLRNNIIKIENNKPFTNLNDSIVVIPTVYENSSKIFELINKFSYKLIPVVGHSGWSLFVVLIMLKNEDVDFIEPTEKLLSNILKKDSKTLRAYLKILQHYDLITIEKQEPIYKGKDEYNNDYFEFAPNKIFPTQEIPQKIENIRYEKDVKTKEKNNGFIYMLTMTGVEHKIGKTRDFNKRLGEYTLLPYKPELILLINIKN